MYIPLLLSESVISENKDVPAFSLENFYGKRVKLINYLGDKPIFLSFFASWCIPCREEIKLINSLAPKYENKIHFIFINIDDQDNVNNAKKMVSGMHKSLIILHDKDQRIARLYDATNIPRSILITKSKKCFKILSGFKSSEEDEIDTAIMNLIKE